MFARILFLFVPCFLTVACFAQQPSAGSSTALYMRAAKSIQEGKIFDANADLEKVLEINPEHVESLYLLALINIELKDVALAKNYLMRGLMLNDRKARRLLVEKFNYTLSYADTMQMIDPSTITLYKKIASQPVASFNELFNSIQSTTTDKRQQLQIMALWMGDNLKPDSKRFFQGGIPLTNAQVYRERIGLCDEYSNVLKAFCDAAAIPNYKVPGYVKYLDFIPGSKFDETNHAWNAVFINSSWLLCDAFWSTTSLSVGESSDPQFVQRREMKYFLGRPEDLITDHLPADPVFQFSNDAISIDAFIKKRDGIDLDGKKIKIDYEDSLKILSAMKSGDRELRIAEHSTAYNVNNPNAFVTEGYNYVADIYNKSTSTKQELVKAKATLKKVLAIIDSSNKPEVKNLKATCLAVLPEIDKRIAARK